MPDVAITIPPDHLGRFEKEALALLSMHAGAVEDERACLERGVPGVTPKRVDTLHERVRNASALVGQLPGQGGRVNADGEILQAVLGGCVVYAADDVAGAAESIGPEARAAVRAAVAEMQMWLDLLDSLEREAAVA